MKDNKCSKCGGEMEEGFVADKSHIGAYRKPEWGTEIKQKFSISGTALENTHDVVTYRCKSCGYLESYAK